MVAMAVLCESRMKFPCLLIDLIGGSLVGILEEDGESLSRYLLE
jgi:hypothetical protein